VASEKIVKDFFTPSGMDDFYQVFGSNREARQSLADGVLDLAKDAAVIDGRVQPGSLNTFLKKHKEALEKLPEVRDSLQSASAANDALVARATRLQEGQTKINQSVLAKLAKTENTQDLIAKSINSKKELMALVSTAKNNGQRMAIIRSIADAIPEIAIKKGMTPIDYVLANEAKLAPVLNRLGPRHLENLKLLSRAETIIRRGDIPAHANVEVPGATMENKLGTSAASLQSQFRAAFITRQQGKHYVIASLLSKYGIKVRGEMAEKIQTEIVKNPELALQLVRSSTQRVPLTDTGNKLRYLLMNAGIRAYATTEDIPQQQ